jgi:hypothetical protein
VVLGILALSPQQILAQWAVGAVGVWLLFAPLVFWAPAAAMYTNDSLVGMQVIALAILIPGMPGMMLIKKPGPDVPPRWTYNPSSWVQRAPVIALGFVGLFGARYLTAFQLGYIDWAWDPSFGNGTARILESDVSKAWPISDAGLGATVYALEALMGFMGGTDRWRTMPWMVLLFGILVVPLGIVSIALVIMQPVMVGTWCTICLFTALAMLIMIPFTLDEVSLCSSSSPAASGKAPRSGTCSGSVTPPRAVARMDARRASTTPSLEPRPPWYGAQRCLELATHDGAGPVAHGGA